LQALAMHETSGRALASWLCLPIFVEIIRLVEFSSRLQSASFAYCDTTINAGRWSVGNPRPASIQG
jgi:hypothetical protein